MIVTSKISLAIAVPFTWLSVERHVNDDVEGIFELQARPREGADASDGSPGRSLWSELKVFRLKVPPQ